MEIPFRLVYSGMLFLFFFQVLSVALLRVNLLLVTNVSE